MSGERLRQEDDVEEIEYADRIDKVEIGACRAQIVVLWKVGIQDDQAGRRPLSGGAKRLTMRMAISAAKGEG